MSAGRTPVAVGVISSPTAAPAIGPYSPALRVGNLLFRLRADSARSGDRVSSSTATSGAQTTRVLQNSASCSRLAAPSSPRRPHDDLPGRIGDFAVVNEIYATFSQNHIPARATVQVARLPGMCASRSTQSLCWIEEPVSPVVIPSSGNITDSQPFELATATELINASPPAPPPAPLPLRGST